MQKILLITQTPNKDAESLTHTELFDLKKNPFSQFFGRILFGKEILYREYFNDQIIKWMHAKGSKCHGSKSCDGREAIEREIKKEYKLIVAFGMPAAKIIFGNNINVEELAKKMENGPIRIDSSSKEEFKGIGTKVAGFPHVSAQAQLCWKAHPQKFSNCVVKTQDEIGNLIK